MTSRSLEHDLAAGLGELRLPGERIRQAAPLLARYAELVHAWAQRLNLTGHEDAHSIAIHLVLDAAALAATLPRARRLIDIGSGAGIPGMPIAILHPDTRVVLVEARERRHHFLRTAIRELGLGNVEALHGRAESLPATPGDCAVAQAAGPFAQVVAWLLRWTEPGGTLAIPVSPTQPIPPAPKTVVGAEVRSYRVPLSGRPRAVWVARRAPD